MASTARRRSAAAVKGVAFVAAALVLSGATETYGAWARPDTYRCLRHAAVQSAELQPTAAGTPASVGDAVRRCTTPTTP